jgi:hypothetical protein
MSLFHRVQFQKPDPLDDGTAEEIAQEKNEAAIDLLDEDTQGIVDYWDNIHKNMKKNSD